MASMASAKLSAALSGSQAPSFDSHDSSVVTKTYERHPAAQCRLDTYMSGDICKVSDSVDVSDRDPDVGVCRNTADEEYGARSRCWYKPANSQAPTPGPTPTPNPGLTPGAAPTPVPAPRPPPIPAPIDGIAVTPLLNGSVEITSSNPNQPIVMTWDVSTMSGARGIYFEVLGPNKEYTEPNGVNPDRQAMKGGSIPQVRGRITILPSRQLPGWGVYKIRIIPLDATGQRPAGRFSNPAVLNLAP